MRIRTLAACVVQGREVRAGLCLDLPQHQAEALIDDGMAEEWQPVERQSVAASVMDASTYPAMRAPITPDKE